jgi:hypothetical protein
MRLNSIRRSQLIAPFGPGAVHIMKQGMAVVTAGLDHWFEDEHRSKALPQQLDRAIVREPRLERMLHVSHFRMPPASDSNTGPGDPKLVTPLLRFPTWFICPRCKQMRHAELSTDGWLNCTHAECRQERLKQVTFAAVCDHGHLQDFPWMEWVHHSRTPQCTGTLYYHAEGGGSLEDIRIECRACNVPPRSLAGIMSGSYGSGAEGDKVWSGLSRRLLASGRGDTAEEFLCEGKCAWLGYDITHNCQRPLRAILINATNVHYANVRSALHLPTHFSDQEMARLQAFLKEAGPRSLMRICNAAGDEVQDIVRKLLDRFADDLPTNDMGKIGVGVQEHLQLPIAGNKSPGSGVSPEGPATLDEITIRKEEYGNLLTEQGSTEDESDLVVRSVDVATLPARLIDFIDAISLVEKLRETKAFAGFSRLMASSSKDAPHPQTMLWRKFPGNRSERWLPATVVYGEGIFFTLNRGRLNAWETQEGPLKTAATLQQNFDDACERYGWHPRTITPRFVLLHTLAHVMINRLVFECGYGSASLRERLYVDNDTENPMAGILIYTASGDSEGSLGGLVRMGEPDNFGRVLFSGLQEARWCSADPVCGEAAEVGGQGPDSLNLAACHSCGLLPETSCEEFNRFLDRHLLARGPAATGSGFFDQVVG